MAGLRTRAVIDMEIWLSDGSAVQQFSESGELQWTEYGISGIVVFQLSRYASATLQQKGRVQVSVDCLPSVTEERLFDLLYKKKEKESIGDRLTGILPKKMIPVILELCQIRKASDRPDETQIKRICKMIKHLPLTVTGTRSFEQAQVCGGGVTLSEIDPCTMESRIISGLYLTGELMDVDGICGGYNLQWAWSTGYLAGKSSAAKLPVTKKEKTMIRIQQLKVPLNYDEAFLRKEIARKLKIQASDIKELRVRKQSLDARKKPDLYYVLTVDFCLAKEQQVLKKKQHITISQVTDSPYQMPEGGSETLPHRPVIAGFGPAGLFCALLLARAGYCPLVLERGADVDQRTTAVEQFWKKWNSGHGIEHTVGEGGAGTFSDGKRIHW